MDSSCRLRSCSPTRAAERPGSRRARTPIVSLPSLTRHISILDTCREYAERQFGRLLAVDGGGDFAAEFAGSAGEMGGHFGRIERRGAGAGRDCDEEPAAVWGRIDRDHLEITKHGISAVARERKAEFSFDLLAELQRFSRAAIWRRCAVDVARIDAVFGTDLRAEEFDLRFDGASFVSRFVESHIALGFGGS